MFYYKAVIQYDGSHYCGFQWQKDISTIQSEINEAIAKLVNTKFSTMGASRTDTGVHAYNQIVKITIDQKIDPHTFHHRLNEVLPPEIRFRSVKQCEGSFKVAADHISKEYRYFFTNKQFLPRKSLQFVTNFSIPLDFDSMRTCLEMIKGVHDFASFSSQGSNVKSTERKIFECELTEVNPHLVFNNSDLFSFPQDMESCYQLRIVGNGFLKQMIRHLMSALWMVGSGKLSVEDFEHLLKGSRHRSQMLWKVAPPNGLFLFDIVYKEG